MTLTSRNIQQSLLLSACSAVLPVITKSASQVGTSVLTERHLIRFEGEGELAGRALLARLEVWKVPAEPAAWRLQLGASSGAPGGPRICSGEAFTLVIAAHDGYGNKCAQSQSIPSRSTEALHRTHAIRPARHLPAFQAWHSKKSFVTSTAVRVHHQADVHAMR